MKKKKIVVILMMFLMSYGLLAMDGPTKKVCVSSLKADDPKPIALLIQEKSPGDSLADCRTLADKFFDGMSWSIVWKKVRSGLPTKKDQMFENIPDARKHHEKKWDELEWLWRSQESDIVVLVGRTDLNSSADSCLIYRINPLNELCVILAFAIETALMNTDVLTQLVDTIAQETPVRNVVTCQRRCQMMHEQMTLAGFEPVNFNPMDCPPDTWQGYRKSCDKAGRAGSLKKIKKRRRNADS